MPQRVVKSFRPKAAPKKGRQWPFVPLAPLAVLAMGVAASVTIAFLGLLQLAQIADDHAGSRAELLSTVVGERLGKLSGEERETAIRTASARTGAEYMLFAEGGRTLVDATVGLPD